MIDDYLNLVTSQHRDRPNYINTLRKLLRKLEDTRILLTAWDDHFNLDTAIGKQLDIIGDLVGVSRVLDFTPDGYSPKLDDDNYRLIIRARIAQNHWDGTIEEMYRLFQLLFPTIHMILEDKQDMTMEITVVGLNDGLKKQLADHGYIFPKPEGVRMVVNVIEDKIFAFDLDDESYAGFDEGEWF